MAARSLAHYDVIIVGGGMIGSVLARSIAVNPVLSSLSVLVLESAKKKDALPSEVYSNRVSALNTSTKELLQHVGLWDSIRFSKCQPVTSMKVWGNGSNKLVTTFVNSDHAKAGEDLAYIVENDVIVDAAFKSLEDFKDRVQVVYESAVSDYDLPSSSAEKYAKVKLRDGSECSCSLLLGADGSNSKVRQKMGVQYLSWDYSQKAIVATLKINCECKNNTAWQKFISTGPIALLPLSDNFSSLVWTTTPQHCDHLLSLSDEGFVDALNTALWEPPVSNPIVDNITSLIGGTLRQLNFETEDELVTPPTIISTVPRSRASFPLGFGHAVKYVAPHVALVGDAAHRVHPLAGQGVNLGFGDVQCLTTLLAEHLSIGEPLGGETFLAEYETQRQRSNVLKMVGIEAIQKVAGQTCSPLMLVTNVAFQVTNAFPFLKKFLINQAVK